MNKNILEPAKCLEIIRKKLSLDSIDESSFTCEFETRKEFSGFLGQYLNLKVRLMNPNSSEVQKLNFFIKLLPMKGVQYNFVKETGCFKTELGLYLKIFPKILTSKEANFIPECFLGQEDYALVLEDMSFQGYMMLDKFQFLQLEDFLIIVKNLALFHVRSLIFEQKNRITVKELCHANEVLINNSESIYQSTLDCFSENLISMVDLIRDIDLEKKSECKAKIARISSQHYKKTAPSTKYRNVLCHCDLWANNILFKHNKTTGKIDKVCFVDFQMAR
ncbi:uncharacterized protein LOC117180636 [Belonocnema kinseyi]|uniref:uncharacterized protein LOC117180636 n=1 Tax=Belonocnema kinseyi TaxID=2817044 RepID=UPI00143CCD0B|nr:uncharacterized protein LOC117180636 [Belonocnema kinseyi]